MTVSMYYCLYCDKCRESLPVFRNGMICDIEPNKLYNFIVKHQEHGIVLLDEHKVDNLKYR